VLSILKYLLNVSFESGIQNELNRLYFHFDRDKSIVIEYEGKSVFYENAVWEVSEDDLVKIANAKILEIYFLSTEYLGYREDIPEYNDPVSKSLQLFETIKKIKRTHHDRVISNYCIVDDYRYDTCDGFGCPDEPNYGFIINMEEVFWRKIETYNLFRTDEFKTKKPSLFYWNSFKNYQKSIPDSGKINILITNTKTRRLGYFSIMANYFIQYEKFSEAIFNKKFEAYAQEHSDHLHSFSNTKGEIKLTKTGNSAGHYTKLAKELGFVNHINRVLSPGKNYKVYLVLKEYYSGNENIFKLSLLDKIFFLETLLSRDYLYLSWLIELIFIEDTTNYRSLNSSFQSFLIQRITELLNANKTKYDTKLRRELAKIKERITKWEKPSTYLEHVIMPRINWLYDLELLEVDNKLNIKLTENGKRLFHNICFITDLKTDRFINFEIAIKAFYIHFFNDVYFCDNKNDFEANFVIKKIEDCIIESFDHFKTLAPNRVTASQAILYVKYKLYLTDRIKVEDTYIVKLLETNTFPNFIFKFQKKYGDGYIQIKN
jgi:hypothetical protein